MGVNFDYYRVFYYVAKYQNITKASEILCVTQPSVTRAIHNLEQQLDCVLFFRKAKGVLLTPEGEMLFKHVRISYELISSAEKEIETMKSLDSGIIRIGTSDVFVRNFLLPYLEFFRNEHPNVQIKMKHISTEISEAVLESGDVDFTITGQPCNGENNLNIQVLKVYHDIAIVGQKYSFLAKKEITLEELSKYPLINMEEGSSTRECYENMFMENGLKLKTSIELAETELTVFMTEQNFGVSFVPPNYAENKIKEGTLFQLNLKEKIPERHICAITHKDRPLGIASKTFMELFI